MKKWVSHLKKEKICIAIEHSLNYVKNLCIWKYDFYINLENSKKRKFNEYIIKG